MSNLLLEIIYLQILWLILWFEQQCPFAYEFLYQWASASFLHVLSPEGYKKDSWLLHMQIGSMVCSKGHR